MKEARVLVVDDEPQFLNIMYRRLRHMELEPDRANDGRAAQVLIERTVYDLIITDIYMPGTTGLALLQQAKRRDPHVQVIIVTAGSSLENAVEALNEGAFAYLNKPFDHLSVFDNTVKQALKFRYLILDNQRMGVAQRRRGDLLEDEIAERIDEYRHRQQELINLIRALPDGIVLIGEGGRISLSNSAAENWLEQERSMGVQPIQRYLDRVHNDHAEPRQLVEIGGCSLRLSVINLSQEGNLNRMAIIIREEEGNNREYGKFLFEVVSNMREGLGRLFRQKLKGNSSVLVKSLALQFFELELLMGLSRSGDVDLPATPTQRKESDLHEQEADMPSKAPPMENHQSTEEVAEEHFPPMNVTRKMISKTKIILDRDKTPQADPLIDAHEDQGEIRDEGPEDYEKFLEGLARLRTDSDGASEDISRDGESDDDLFTDPSTSLATSDSGSEDIQSVPASRGWLPPLPSEVKIE